MLRLPSISWAECPKWIREDQTIPKCPSGETFALPNTYPAMAHFISDSGVFASDHSSDITYEFVKNVFQSAGERTPLVFFPSTNQSFENLSARLAHYGNSTWMSHLVHVPMFPDGSNSTTVGFTFFWLQDLLIPFFDPIQSKSWIRPIASYLDAGSREFVTRLAEVAHQTCDRIGAGLFFPDDGQAQMFQARQFSDWMSGGNFTMLPGEICLHGNGPEWESYSKYYCKDQNHEIIASTSWLYVGHLDEIVSVIPNPSLPAPCHFSILMASPSRAIELLRTQPSGIFLNETYRNFRQSEGGRKSYFDFVPFYNQVSQINGPSHVLLNSEFLDLFSRSYSLFYLNSLAQQKMDQLKEKIVSKISEILPECKNHIDVIDVPDLFFSPRYSIQQNELDWKGLTENDSRWLAQSIFPPMVNGVVSENTVILPDPHQPIFSEYLEKELRKRQVRVSFMNTLDLHEYDGNLHCFSNTLRVCR